MAKYRVTSPDGTKWDVTAPDDATEEQVMEYAASQFGQQRKQEQPSQQKPITESIAGMPGELAKGVGRGVESVGKMLVQGIGNVMPQPLGELYKGIHNIQQWPRKVFEPGYSGSVMDDKLLRAAGTTGEMIGAGLPFGQPMPGVAAGTGALEYFFGDAGKALGPTIPLLASAGRAGGAMATRGYMRGTSPEQMTRNIELLKKAGIETPSVGLASQKFGAQGLESTVAKIPGGAGTMQRKGAEVAEALGGRVDDIAATVSPARTASQGGRALQTGTEQFADDLSARFRTINAPVDQKLSGTAVDVSNFRNVLAEKGSPIKGAEDLSLLLGAREGKLVAAQKALSEQVGPLPYDAVRELRSAIGEKLTNPSLIDDISRRTYKKLYAALSEDLRGAANAAGVLKPFNDANKVFTAGVDRLEGIMSQISSKGTWQEAYQAATSGMGKGAEKIWALKRSIGDKNFNDFRAVVIRDLGVEKSSVGNAIERGFSPETFLTNYRSLPENTKMALFGKNTTLRESLDNAAEAAGMLRASGRVFANPSGTGATVGAIATGASIPTAFAFILGGNPGVGASLLGGAAGTSLAALGGAKLMTNPAFMKWLNQSTKIPVTKMASHVARLNAIASMEKDEETKSAMQEVATSLSGPRQIYSEQEQ